MVAGISNAFAAFLSFLLFLLGAIEELTRGDWGIFTPLSFALLGLCALTFAIPMWNWSVRRRP